jgi:hypothetical protein
MLERVGDLGEVGVRALIVASAAKYIIEEYQEL